MPNRSMARTRSANFLPAWPYWSAGAVLMLFAASTEFSEGRKLWGVSGEPGIWSGQVLSAHNSQYLADPYTFTHITHGILIFAALWFLARNRSLADRALMALAFECTWEVIENTSFVIHRYRAQTLALNYYGDSVMNSMTDILACMLGFFIASKLPAWATVLVVLVMEIGLALWIHDGLLLNILMLIYPLQAIKRWQAGYS